MIVDIDHFKRFNDTHGHPGADALLAEFGLLPARHSRDEDIAVRYDAVIGEADAALYRAKQNGRDRVECAGAHARENVLSQSA